MALAHRRGAGEATFLQFCQPVWEGGPLHPGLTARMHANGRAGLIYVLVPMPFLFFGSGGGEYADDGCVDLTLGCIVCCSGALHFRVHQLTPSAPSSVQRSWVDVSKFLTGMTVVYAIGVPVRHRCCCPAVHLHLSSPPLTSDALRAPSFFLPPLVQRCGY